MDKFVYWSADAYGYSVRVFAGQRIIEEYAAGNCRYDSQQFLSPGEPGSLGLRELRNFAQRTAADMAAEYGADVIEEATDLLLL